MNELSLRAIEWPEDTGENWDSLLLSIEAVETSLNVLTFSSDPKVIDLIESATFLMALDTTEDILLYALCVSVVKFNLDTSECIYLFVRNSTGNSSS